MPIKKNTASSGKSETKSTSKSEAGSRSSSSTALIEPQKTEKSLVKKTASSPLTTERQQQSITRITIRYDVGFNNSLFLRGKGANLSWDKGTRLKNVKADEWVFETDLPFTNLEFKVLINDQDFEVGPNHTISHGSTIQFNPRFF